MSVHFHSILTYLDWPTGIFIFSAVAAAGVGVEDEARFNFGRAAMRPQFVENDLGRDEKTLKLPPHNLAAFQLSEW